MYIFPVYSSEFFSACRNVPNYFHKFGCTSYTFLKLAFSTYLVNPGYLFISIYVGLPFLHDCTCLTYFFHVGSFMFYLVIFISFFFTLLLRSTLYWFFCAIVSNQWEMISAFCSSFKSYFLTSAVLVSFPHTTHNHYSHIAAKKKRQCP